MDDKYTVTFKVAEIRANYYKDLKTKETDTSSAGHLWFVLQKNGSESQSWGFQRIEDTFFDGYVSDKDDSRYYEVADSITIQLSKKQYEILDNFGREPEKFGFKKTYYNVTTNNCVTFVFRALNLIGYNYDGGDYTFAAPGLVFSSLILQLAKNGAIAVEGNTLIPVSEKKGIHVPIPDNVFYVKTNNTIVGYDNNDDVIYGGTGSDKLIGKSGNDTLIGGPHTDDWADYSSILDTDNDTLEGGEDFDTYYAGEGDTIIDSDGKGEVYFQVKGHNLKKYYEKYNEKEHFLYIYDRIPDEPLHLQGDELNKGLLTYATLESYTPGSSTAVFSQGQMNEDEERFYMPFRYEVQGLKLPSQRPDSPLVNFTADWLIVTPIDENGKTVGKSIKIKDFRNGQLGIHLLDIMSYRYSYYGGYPSFYAHTATSTNDKTGGGVPGDRSGSGGQSGLSGDGNWGGKNQRRNGDKAHNLTSPEERKPIDVNDRYPRDDRKNNNSDPSPDNPNKPLSPRRPSDNEQPSDDDIPLDPPLKPTNPPVPFPPNPKNNKENPLSDEPKEDEDPLPMFSAKDTDGTSFRSNITGCG